MKFLWVFDIDAVWTLAPICAVLWALGGSGIKLLRRLGVGLILCVSSLSMGLVWWMAGLETLAMFAVTSLPYGDSLKRRIGGFYYLALFFIGAAFGAALLPIAFLKGKWLIYGLAPIFTACAFGPFAFSSQQFGFPIWKWCEMLTGFTVGLMASLLMV